MHIIVDNEFRFYAAMGIGHYARERFSEKISDNDIWLSSLHWMDDESNNYIYLYIYK